MKLSALELASALVLAAVVAYSAGGVAARTDGTVAGLAGDWQAAFTLDHAYPRDEDDLGRTVAARVHIDPGPPGPSRSTDDARPDALDGDLRVFGLRGEALRGTRVHPARGDSVEITLGSGGREVVLVGKVQCARVAGRWRRASRAETETGHFELRRSAAASVPDGAGRIHTTGGQG
jgi:hypothetical protein